MKRVWIALLALVLLVTVVAVTPVAAADVLYGDVDGNGEIANRDLGLLQRYVNGWDVTIDLAAADVNADGVVTNKDLGLLQRSINGWDVTLGPKVPLAELPPVGYDPDGKGRVYVEYIRQEGDTVVVGFHNRSTQWMTEETSYVQYCCTDAEGNELELNVPYYGKVYLGMLEADTRVEKTFKLPEGTAKVEFTDWYIIYWSQWA